MWGLHASIFEESHSRCEEGVTNVPARRGCTAAEEISIAPMVLSPRPTGLASPEQADRED